MDRIAALRTTTDLVVVGMGGGGIASGMAIAMKDARPELAVWGVQPEANPVLVEWLRAGRPVPVEEGTSVAEGLGARIEEDSVTFPLALKYVDDTVVVSDEEIKDAMAFLLERRLEQGPMDREAALDQLREWWTRHSK